eukprot:9903731-Alexandrium_andersonii.AAC.1
MSASLVGSEMCIRDRARRSVPSRSVQHGREGRAARGLRHPGTPAGGKTCLLYTSDAADDM